MHSNDNGEIKLFQREVPEGMHVDPKGLVESWIAIAEDWMMAYEGIDQLAPQEAFEGIEHLGRLTRCRNDLIEQASGQDVIQRLQTILFDPRATTAFCSAIEFPDLDGWIEQLTEAWENDLEDIDLVRQLIEDLDASDFLLWYWDSVSPEKAERSSVFDAFEDRLVQCHLRLDRHATLFPIGEPYIRAAALTIPENIDSSDDPTGRLTESAAKYIRLLDACEEAWKNFELPSATGIIKNQPRYGTLKIDYHVPVLSSAAAAQEAFIPSRRPLKWISPDSQTQALLMLPSAVLPGNDTQFDLLFGEGEGFSQPPAALLGATVQLGRAVSVIEQTESKGLVKIFARISPAAVSSTPERTISLLINDQEWCPCS
jgi:hypothetical protein